MFSSPRDSGVQTGQLFSLLSLLRAGRCVQSTELPFDGRASVAARSHWRVAGTSGNVVNNAGITRRGRGAARAALVGRDDCSVHSAAAGGAAGYACCGAESGSDRRKRAAGVRCVMVRLPGLQKAQRAARGLRPVRAKVGLHPLGRPIGKHVASGRSQLSARGLPRRRELRHDKCGTGDG